MLIDWIHWLSSMPREKLLFCLLPLLLTDIPRYSLEALLTFLADFFSFHSRSHRSSAEPIPQARESVCIVIVGYNEAHTIEGALSTVWSNNSGLEIIVIDDGSTDGMFEVANRFAATHPGVFVFRKPIRGGKSSALNYALACTQAKIIVCIDADSQLDPTAISELLRPFNDPRVGAVAGNVRIRNPFDSVASCLQAFEYLQCIFLGRRLSSRLGVLCIVSGAFGAYRREALHRTMGWDVGPGEDLDLTMKLRKSGYKAVFAPQAECLTRAAVSWKTLARQRRRWDWGTVTFCCRKHVDLGNPLRASFRFSDLACLADRWFFNIAMTYFLWGYAFWLCFNSSDITGYLLFLYYVIYVALSTFQLAVILYFSRDRLRDLWLGAVIPLSPFYYVFLRAIALWSTTEELIFRSSFRDDFVPQHVRSSTWHW